ncbi:MAG: trypsin-like peptidase domain-containing protein [bacterium]|nr:trypsin-like peptidase domain-containing protein [Candidatus Kapabacteria bacterium]
MATALTDLSDAIATLVERTSQSLVSVDARRRFPASAIVWSSDGLIVTNHHVVHRDNDIRVHLPDGSKVAAELIGRDQTTDVALLKADTKGLTPADWTTHDALKIGHVVVGVSNAGPGVHASLGLISSVAGRWKTRGGGELDAFIETDLPIILGFSGSPLVSASGELIGINSSALLRGASIAIPHATIARSVETLAKHGRIPQGYLGVSSYPVDLPEGFESDNGTTGGRGLLVVTVERNSPAENAGIIVGDIVVSVAGSPTRGSDTLRTSLGADTIGREIDVIVVRGGEPKALKVTVAARK